MTTRKLRISKMPPARMHVRMYRQGLGDCFLITLPAAADKPFYMLIDCGVVLGTPDPATRMKKVVEDITQVTNGEVDVLVVTHEHWDHVSGFVQARNVFDKLKIKQVWLAWTEDPQDPLATRLRQERRSAEKALRMAVNYLAVSGDNETAQRVDSLVGFFGAGTGSTEDALNYVKTLAGGKPRYCEPGQPPIEIPRLPGVRFFVLGPPKDERLIRKSNPGKTEAYGLDALTRTLNAGAAGSPEEDALQDPFDRVHAIPIARAEQLPFFQKRYYGEAADAGIYDRTTSKEIRDQSWRRIDSAWMESAETMALQLDAATNNTSLVLAIELTATGEVLLFPGDAQAGSWLSWPDLNWEKVIFYKVGHHGSHNATLKAKGLELMVNSNLVAMIPVDHEMAVKKHWDCMPMPELVDRIRQRTHGRVLRSDDQVNTAAELDKLKPETIGAEEWKQFAGRVDVTDLYYDLAF
jgi:hypothetical protein